MEPRGDECRTRNDSEHTKEYSRHPQEISYSNGERDDERFLLLGRDNEFPWRRSWRKNMVLSSVTILNAILFVTSISMLSLSSKTRGTTDQDHWRATSFYSPVFDRLTIPKHVTTTNGTFWDTSPPSIWRAKGVAADAAWESIGSNISPILITAADVLALGKDPAVAVKAPTGGDSYIAGMDVFHHLHCLDKLRREIAGMSTPEDAMLHSAHISHCIDVLAQALKCSASVDMVTFNWVQGHRMPQPDFSNKKICRSFEAVRTWTIDNGFEGEEWLKGVKGPPEGAVVLKEVRP